MRFALFLVLGVFIWACTVSIKHLQQSSTVTASSGSTCSDQFHGDRLLAYLKMGTITRIHDNGHILTIGLSTQWRNLPLAFNNKPTTPSSAMLNRSIDRFSFLRPNHFRFYKNEEVRKPGGLVRRNLERPQGILDNIRVTSQLRSHP